MNSSKMRFDVAGDHENHLESVSCRSAYSRGYANLELEWIVAAVVVSNTQTEKPPLLTTAWQTGCSRSHSSSCLWIKGHKFPASIMCNQHSKTAVFGLHLVQLLLNYVWRDVRGGKRALQSWNEPWSTLCAVVESLFKKVRLSSSEPLSVFWQKCVKPHFPFCVM